MKKLLIAAAAVPALVLGAVACGPTEQPGHKTTADAPAAKAESSQKESGPATSFEDGTYLVGSDVKAGTYKTTGETDDDLGMGCYWERAKNDSGSMDAIIANNYANGPGRVTVNSGEVFKVSGGCEWLLVK